MVLRLKEIADRFPDKCFRIHLALMDWLRMEALHPWSNNVLVTPDQDGEMVTDMCYFGVHYLSCVGRTVI